MQPENATPENVASENLEEIYDNITSPENNKPTDAIPVKPERTQPDTKYSNCDENATNASTSLPRNLSHDIVEIYSIPDPKENKTKNKHHPNIQGVPAERKTFLKFLSTFEGALFIAEVLGSFLCWVLLVAWSYAGPYYRMPPLLGVSLFIFVTSWILTTWIFVILLLGVDLKLKWMSVLRQNKFGLIYNSIWAISYVVAGGISASYAVDDTTQVLGASTSITFVVIILYFSHFLANFYKLYKKSPCAYIATCSIVCQN